MVVGGVGVLYEEVEEERWKSRRKRRSRRSTQSSILLVCEKCLARTVDFLSVSGNTFVSTKTRISSLTLQITNRIYKKKSWHC